MTDTAHFRGFHLTLRRTHTYTRETARCRSMNANLEEAANIATEYLSSLYLLLRHTPRNVPRRP